MKQTIHVVMLTALISIFIFSCSNKNQQDPTPSKSTSNYRLQSVEIKGTGIHDQTTYAHDASGNVSTVTTKDSVGNTKRITTYTYNAQGYISSYFEQNYGSSTSAYKYEYTYDANNLVTNYKYYSSATSTPVLSSSTDYYYAVNKDLLYYVRKNGSSSTYKDSVVFSGYSNGRSSLKRSFSNSSGAYKLYQKVFFTYDSRMNRVKEEKTLSYNADTVSIYNTLTHTFIIMDDQAAYKQAILFDNYTSDNLDNHSPNSKDSDVDYESAFTSSTSCGLTDQFTEAFVEKNDRGLPTKLTSTVNGYNCGSLTSSDVSNATIVYETY